MFVPSWPRRGRTLTMGAARRRSSRRACGYLAASLSAVLLTAACADFSSAPATYEAQPSLSPQVAVPVEPEPPRVGQSSSSSPSSSSSQQSSEQSSAQSSSSANQSTPSSAPPEDPCRPADQAIIAACLDAPWGLAVLPGGQSALVGERTSGKILTIAPNTAPVEYATIPGLDSGGSGGLLGIALSPSYAEDRLLYAYVTTQEDNRVLRIAQGDTPKPILTGIPKGATHNGGRIEFGPTGYLYIGTGDTGNPELAADPKSLAGKVLRIDTFGKPAADNPDSTSPVYASGFTDITGMCLLTDGMGALDHRTGADVLIRVEPGGQYAEATDPVWSWTTAEGGASDCALSSTQLGFSSLTAERVVGITTTSDGGFSGTPTPLMHNQYGRVVTLTLGGGGTPEEVFWGVTSNKDGHGSPGASDDLVFVVQASSGGGDGGND